MSDISLYCCKCGCKILIRSADPVIVKTENGVNYYHCTDCFDDECEMLWWEDEE